MSNQPEWQAIAQLGDVNPIDYGGYFVLVDRTGVYPPEGEWVDAPQGDINEWTVYRFILEQCTFINGILSDNKYHPDHEAWFADDISAIADCNGIDADTLRVMLCSDDPVQLAEGYRVIGSYHGFHEFDHYPLTFTDREEIEARYDSPQYRIAKPTR